MRVISTIVDQDIDKDQFNGKAWSKIKFCGIIAKSKLGKTLKGREDGGGEDIALLQLGSGGRKNPTQPDSVHENVKVISSN